MATQTVSHDGAESRINYENPEIEELPSTVVLSEITSEVNHQQVGHGHRDRYQFEAESLGETDSHEFEVTVTDDGYSGSQIRATYLEDDSQVFFGSSNSSAEELIEGEDELDGEALERRY